MKSTKTSRPKSAKKEDRNSNTGDRAKYERVREMTDELSERGFPKEEWPAELKNLDRRLPPILRKLARQ